METHCQVFEDWMFQISSNRERGRDLSTSNTELRFYKL